jgi:hypothetical protein
VVGEQNSEVWGCQNMDGVSRGEWCQQHSKISAVSGYPFTFGVTWEKDAPILVRCEEIKLDISGGAEKYRIYLVTYTNNDK